MPELPYFWIANAIYLAFILNDSDTLWTVVRGSTLEEGESQGLPVWRRHVGDPIAEERPHRRVDFAPSIVEVHTDPELVHG